MRVALQPDAGALLLEFDATDEIERFFGEAASNQGFFLDLEQPPRQYQTFQCTASGPDGFRFAFEAETIQVFPRAAGVGAAFQLHSWNDLKQRELERRLTAATKDDGGEQAGVSPVFRIKTMNPKQKALLARKASRSERQILLRDHNAEVLGGLLNHPRLEEAEVLEIAKSPHTTGAIMKRVADNSKWMQNADIRVVIVRSPKTPTPLAIKYLSTLPTPELQTLAKMGNAREVLRKEALKIYLQRIGGKGGG
ncbi:MAG TPA: hypothetical protein VMS86_06115 [Thermoanaerobaculia bacterium]|nr:hypothetical protein [Thermoanaerobaculia bacterium]